jgi:hypothetical protein
MREGTQMRVFLGGQHVGVRAEVWHEVMLRRVSAEGKVEMQSAGEGLGGMFEKGWMRLGYLRRYSS